MKYVLCVWIIILGLKIKNKLFLPKNEESKEQTSVNE